LSTTYDSLEARIDVLMEQEELSKIRPDLDGAQVMQLLNLKPSREVGQAMEFLMELRLEQGPIGEEAATKALLEWWASR
jgi:poly(A) polymerase